jgi:hypothetical protein
MTIVEEPFLIVDGVLQDDVMSVRVDAVQAMGGLSVDFDAYDFY